MGFFDRIRTGRLFFGKKEPSMVVSFQFKTKKYILEEFDLEFGQEVNAKGKPDSLPSGGRITITISEVPDESINSWMMNSYQKQDGEFRFLINDNMINQGAVLQIQFRDAYCIDYRKSLNPQGAGSLTTLVISPRYIRVGNEEFENRWQ